MPKCQSGESICTPLWLERITVTGPAGGAERGRRFNGR
jgi:hypothetical protein